MTRNGDQVAIKEIIARRMVDHLAALSMHSLLPNCMFCAFTGLEGQVSRIIKGVVEATLEH